MMKNISNEMLKELDKIGKQRNKDQLIESLVDRILVPNFDLVAMSRAVVGGEPWRNATPEVQQQFIKEFTRFVTSTYSSALKAYDGEKMRFHPIRGKFTDKVRISSDLVMKNGSRVRLQYSLEKQASRWLIYDFSVDGVSIVNNYRSQFAGSLRQNGLTGLVKELESRRLKGSQSRNIRQR
jgi:phospholipid transport system substrate-binding protein